MAPTNKELWIYCFNAHRNRPNLAASASAAAANAGDGSVLEVS